MTEQIIDPAALFKPLWENNPSRGLLSEYHFNILRQFIFTFHGEKELISGRFINGKLHVIIKGDKI